MRAQIRPMTTHDIPAGLRLSREAGWNQLEQDWRMFLEFPNSGGFVGSVGFVGSDGFVGSEGLSSVGSVTTRSMSADPPQA